MLQPMGSQRVGHDGVTNTHNTRYKNLFSFSMSFSPILGLGRPWLLS